MKHDHPELASVVGPFTGQDWLRRFERFAEHLASEHEARTGHRLPGNQGFSAPANKDVGHG
jgi:hypothetical protein